MSDIFVSYASGDRDRVAPLVQRLEQLGFSVWWDRDIAHGQNFHRVIEQALDAAKCAVVVWSHASIGSEWVINEASSARKRGALVPVAIDAVEVPLEFRHLQTADLSDGNAQLEREYDKLKRSVQQIVASASAQPAAAARPGPVTAISSNGKSFWHSPIGWAIGAGALLFGAAVLLAVLKQLGWIGSVPSTVQPAPAVPPTLASPQPSEAAVPNASADHAEPAVAAPTGAKRTAAERINLLDPEHGAQLVAAGEENWRRILEGKEPVCAIISAQSFALVSLSNEQPAAIDTLAVHVDAQASYNVKTLALFKADAERGPFTKIGEFDIPNYKNMRTPFHEFEFARATARFVKLQVLNFHHGDGPNGNVCSLRLYGPDESINIR